MNKGIEILVVDSLSGEIKHRVHETFYDSMPLDYQVKRFEAFSRGFLRLMKDSSNNVIQLSFKDIPDCEEGRIWECRSFKQARYVHPAKMDKKSVF